MKDEDTLLRMDLSLEREHQTTQIMSKDNASESEVKLFFFFPCFFSGFQAGGDSAGQTTLDSKEKTATGKSESDLP